MNSVSSGTGAGRGGEHADHTAEGADGHADTDTKKIFGSQLKPTCLKLMNALSTKQKLDENQGSEEEKQKVESQITSGLRTLCKILETQTDAQVSRNCLEYIMLPLLLCLPTKVPEHSLRMELVFTAVDTLLTRVGPVYFLQGFSRCDEFLIRIAVLLSPWHTHQRSVRNDDSRSASSYPTEGTTVPVMCCLLKLLAALCGVLRDEDSTENAFDIANTSTSKYCLVDHYPPTLRDTLGKDEFQFSNFTTRFRQFVSKQVAGLLISSLLGVVTQGQYSTHSMVGRRSMFYTLACLNLYAMLLRHASLVVKLDDSVAPSTFLPGVVTAMHSTITSVSHTSSTLSLQSKILESATRVMITVGGVTCMDMQENRVRKKPRQHSLSSLKAMVTSGGKKSVNDGEDTQQQQQSIDKLCGFIKKTLRCLVVHKDRREVQLSALELCFIAVHHCLGSAFVQHSRRVNWENLINALEFIAFSVVLDDHEVRRVAYTLWEMAVSFATQAGLFKTLIRTVLERVWRTLHSLPRMARDEEVDDGKSDLHESYSLDASFCVVQGLLSLLPLSDKSSFQDSVDSVLQPQERYAELATILGQCAMLEDDMLTQAPTQDIAITPNGQTAKQSSSARSSASSKCLAVMQLAPMARQCQVLCANCAEKRYVAEVPLCNVCVAMNPPFPEMRLAYLNYPVNFKNMLRILGYSFGTSSLRLLEECLNLARSKYIAAVKAVDGSRVGRNWLSEFFYVWKAIPGLMFCSIELVRGIARVDIHRNKNDAPSTEKTDSVRRAVNLTIDFISMGVGEVTDNGIHVPPMLFAPLRTNGEQSLPVVCASRFCGLRCWCLTLVGVCTTILGPDIREFLPEHLFSIVQQFIGDSSRNHRNTLSSDENSLPREYCDLLTDSAFSTLVLLGGISYRHDILEDMATSKENSWYSSRGIFGPPMAPGICQVVHFTPLSSSKVSRELTQYPPHVHQTVWVQHLLTNNFEQITVNLADSLQSRSDISHLPPMLSGVVSCLRRSTMEAPSATTSWSNYTSFFSLISREVCVALDENRFNPEYQQTLMSSAEIIVDALSYLCRRTTEREFYISDSSTADGALRKTILEQAEMSQFRHVREKAKAIRENNSLIAPLTAAAQHWVIEVAKRAVHQATSDERRCAVDSMRVIRAVCSALAATPGTLYPLLNDIWDPLSTIFDLPLALPVDEVQQQANERQLLDYGTVLNGNDVVPMHTMVGEALDLLLDSIYRGNAGDFLSPRLEEQLWPKIRDSLTLGGATQTKGLHFRACPWIERNARRPALSKASLNIVDRDMREESERQITRLQMRILETLEVLLIPAAAPSTWGYKGEEGSEEVPQWSYKYYVLSQLLPECLLCTLPFLSFKAPVELQGRAIEFIQLSRQVGIETEKTIEFFLQLLNRLQPNQHIGDSGMIDQLYKFHLGSDSNGAQRPADDDSAWGWGKLQGTRISTSTFQETNGSPGTDDDMLKPLSRNLSSSKYIASLRNDDPSWLDIVRSVPVKSILGSLRLLMQQQ
eukprot:gb/GECG01004181.1/.p1 GENE.gb/GECG01004181.1/~~gb/GECG01004181.1/.p1  ORF type:complete len:1516 (+),score=155.28 gb/GECG01004181.1/:1-4548(+)